MSAAAIIKLKPCRRVSLSATLKIHRPMGEKHTTSPAPPPLLCIIPDSQKKKKDGAAGRSMRAIWQHGGAANKASKGDGN